MSFYMGKRHFCKKGVVGEVGSHFAQSVLNFIFMSVSSLLCFTDLAPTATESMGKRASKRKQQHEK